MDNYTFILLWKVAERDKANVEIAHQKKIGIRENGVSIIRLTYWPNMLGLNWQDLGIIGASFRILRREGRSSLMWLGDTWWENSGKCACIKVEKTQ